jgi:tetratricopeptide (TPR) repeat protein
MQFRKQLLIIAALGLMGATVSLPAHANNPKPSKPPVIKSASDAYSVAWKLWSQGEATKAEELLRQQSEHYASDPRLGLFLATSVASHGTDTEAETYFSRVVELGAKSEKPSATALAAQHFLHLSDPDTAREAFAALTELAKSQGNDPVIIWLFAQAAERQEKPELAEKAFQSLLKKTKNAPAVVRQGYADALEAQGKHFYALEHRLKAAKLDANPWTLHALSNNLRTLARFSEAAAVAEVSAKHFPTAPQAWHDLGVASLALHRNDIAVAQLSKAAQLSESSTDRFDRQSNLLTLATCLESQKKYGEAADTFRQLAVLQGVSAEQAHDANLRARAAELAQGGQN